MTVGSLVKGLLLEDWPPPPDPPLTVVDSAAGVANE